MTSYNQVDGVWASENPGTISQDLYSEIGFQGFTVTDAAGIHSTGPSLNAGLAQEFGAPYYFTPVNLHAALAAGTITTQQIYNAAFRVVRSYIANGLFDNPLPPTASPNVSTPEHLDIALKMAEEGTVLLKNNHILPIRMKGQRIAVIGPTASAVATNGISTHTVCTASAGIVVDCPNVAAPSIQLPPEQRNWEIPSLLTTAAIRQRRPVLLRPPTSSLSSPTTPREKAPIFPT